MGLKFVTDNGWKPPASMAGVVERVAEAGMAQVNAAMAEVTQAVETWMLGVFLAMGKNIENVDEFLLEDHDVEPATPPGAGYRRDFKLRWFPPHDAVGLIVSELPVRVTFTVDQG